MISQTTARPTGNASPSTGRDQRAARSRVALRCSGVTCPAAIVMDTKDIPTPGATQAARVRLAFAARAMADAPGWPCGSVGQRHAGVDQGVDCALHVNVGLDDTGLLERKPCRQDRLALRRADLVVGQFGALLELLVH